MDIQCVFCPCYAHIQFSLFLCASPVSYTHLDVYKRQVYTVCKTRILGGTAIPPGGRRRDFFLDCALDASFCGGGFLGNGFEEAPSSRFRLGCKAEIVQPYKLIRVVRGLLVATAAVPASTAARGRGAAAGAGAAAAGRWPAGGGLVAVADVAGAGGAGAAWAVHIQAVAAGVGIAHGVVVGVGVAVLRDGCFQIAQVGVAGGEGAKLGVVVPCAQVRCV